MAIGYNQRVCNARNLAATLNDIVGSLGENVIVEGRPEVVRLEDNDNILICWYEGMSSLGYTRYVLDGSDDEDWRTLSTNTTGYYRLALYDDNIPIYPDYGYSGIPTQPVNVVVSNQFPEGWRASPTNNALPYTRHQTIMLHETTGSFVQVYHPDYQTVDAWRAHLAEYPLIVYVKNPE